MAPTFRACWRFLLAVVISAVVADASKLNYVMYLTGQHKNIPEPALVSDITHVALAFLGSERFNIPGQNEWPLILDVEEVRSRFPEGTNVQVAIGGWGNEGPFSTAAKTEESRKLFATNVKDMLDATGADGIDIDWEYPGGNGEHYRTYPNPGKTWEIDAYPKLLAEIRTTIGSSRVISAAVPGLPRDMLAFTGTTLPKIMESLDFINVMTYDLMNRRDNVTKHHTGLEASLEAIDAYLDGGVPPAKINLGLAFYVKWFKTLPGSGCHEHPIGCKTELMEDLAGGDLGKAGGFSWHDQVPEDRAVSFDRALTDGQYDSVGGGHYYWDEQEGLFWSWDTPEAIKHKLDVIMEEKSLGGIFAWGLGEDAPKFEHLRAATKFVRQVAPQSKEGVAQGERSEL